MDNLIRKYFTAWENKDIQLLEEVLTPRFKGIRTFFEEKLFNLDDVIYTLKNKRHIKYTVLDIDHKMTFSYVDCYLNINGTDELVTLKFSYENGLIDSVYETAKLVDKIRVKCIVSYDGSMFNGYQKQPNKITVQGEIEKAIFNITKEKVIIHSSGRTDKGVHAYNQVFHFDTESSIKPEMFQKVLNNYLKDGIYIKDSMEVHETFHSRYDILSKEYVYVINKLEYDVIKRNYEYYPGEFDVSVFKESLKTLIGTHDFTSLTKTNELSNIRTIYDIKFVENSKYLLVYIKGNGFLRYMVRNIIAAALGISTNKVLVPMRVLINKKDNTILKDIAPASGLYMNEVTYHE